MLSDSVDKVQFQISDVEFPSQNGVFYSMKVTSSEPNVYTIWTKSNQCEQEWSNTFKDLSQCAIDNGNDLASDTILPNLIQALIVLKTNTGNEGFPKPECDMKTSELVTLKIPFGETFVSYNFKLLAMEIADKSDLQIEEEYDVQAIKKLLGSEMKKLREVYQDFMFNDVIQWKHPVEEEKKPAEVKKQMGTKTISRRPRLVKSQVIKPTKSDSLNARPKLMRSNDGRRATWKI